MFLTPQIRYQLFAHIRKYASAKSILIDYIGGMPDHIHCLILLNPKQTLSEVIHLIKGESSHWYNSRGKGKICWQNEYYAISVSPDRVEQVRKYIRNQEKHHRRMSFAEEYNNIMQTVTNQVIQETFNQNLEEVNQSQETVNQNQETFNQKSGGS